MENTKYGFYLMESCTDSHSLYGEREMIGPTVTKNGFATEEEAYSEACKTVDRLHSLDTYYDIHTYSYNGDARITEEIMQKIIESSRNTWAPFVIYDYREYPVDEVIKILETAGKI